MQLYSLNEESHGDYYDHISYLHHNYNLYFWNGRYISLYYLYYSVLNLHAAKEMPKK